MLSWETIVALFSLTLMEVALGIDNLVFISVVSEKLPAKSQPRARRLGLLAAMISRILLLFVLAYFLHLASPLFFIGKFPVSIRNIVFCIGGVFLLYKGTKEIHLRLEGVQEFKKNKQRHSLLIILLEIVFMDVVFSLDSIIVALAMAKEIWVMVLAIILSVAIMMFFAEKLNSFLQLHPTFKILALSFLLLIGVSLIAEALGKHIERGYIYFAMIFSLFVEILNLKIKKRKMLKSS
ncbi:MAG: hypothetical protein PWR24_1047 [Desulfonauticus sp.]|nr:MAG: integral membrane protein TerC [Desulfonauticus sp. 38_4375]MDK2921490.1 hypothetical protein [Desulfonauticus sp.]